MVASSPLKPVVPLELMSCIISCCCMLLLADRSSAGCRQGGAAGRKLTAGVRISTRRWPGSATFKATAPFGALAGFQGSHGAFITRSTFPAVMSLSGNAIPSVWQIRLRHRKDYQLRSRLWQGATAVASDAGNFSRSQTSNFTLQSRSSISSDRHLSSLARSANGSLADNYNSDSNNDSSRGSTIICSVRDLHNRDGSGRCTSSPLVQLVELPGECDIGLQRYGRFRLTASRRT